MHASNELVGPVSRHVSHPGWLVAGVQTQVGVFFLRSVMT